MPYSLRMRVHANVCSIDALFEIKLNLVFQSVAIEFATTELSCKSCCLKVVPDKQCFCTDTLEVFERIQTDQSVVPAAWENALKGGATKL